MGKKSIYWTMAICLLFTTTFVGASQPDDESVIVSLMVDNNVPTLATNEQVNNANDNLVNVLNAFYKGGINGTLFLTQDVTSSNARVFVTQLGLTGPFELAMSGNHSDEKLSTKSYLEQKAILERSKILAEACSNCGVNEAIIRGFIPQSFDQNEDTFKVLDDLGIDYDAGFQAGILYTPGHENDVKPYKVDNHNFYAVPVSTYDLSGEKVALDDRLVKDKSVSSSEWLNMLKGKFDEASSKEEPMVVSLSTSVSGIGDYLDALNQFIDYALSNNAKFVTTMDLVNMSRTGDYEVPAATIIDAKQNAESQNETDTTNCTTCKELTSNSTPSAMIINLTLPKVPTSK